MTERESEVDVEKKSQSEDTSETQPTETQSDGRSETVRDRSVDDAAESFLELEETLSPTDSVETLPDGTESVRGQIVDVDRVDGTAVPADYPWTITTETVLALEVEVGVGTHSADRFTLYFGQEADGTPGDRLLQLLELLEIPLDSISELHGRIILLTVREGRLIPILPEERPTGSTLGVYGVYAGLVFNLVFVGLAVLTGMSLPAFVGFVLVNFFVLPVATALDAWYLRTHTDWGQGPWFWALLSMLPVINIVTTIGYLHTRRTARPVADP